jgi:hypothetical protein
MKEIQLSQNRIAIVDDEEYEGLMKWKWSYTKVGYASRWYRKDGKRYSISMHRQIMGAVVGGEIDHINNNSLDNRKENLRPCTRQQNCCNYPTKNHTSKFKGVHHHARNNSWISQIKVKGKNIHIGSFRREEEAARAYNQKATEMNGEFAYLNKIL